MRLIRSYLLEDCNYPVCILGGDRFCDWFSVAPPPINLTTEYVFEIMKASYDLGVLGFDISCRFNVIEAFSRLKKIYPDIIGIGNPNWKCGYKLGDVHLWDIKERIISTIIHHSIKEEGVCIPNFAGAPEACRFEKYLNGEIKTLTELEIGQIYIDEAIWLGRIKQLRDITDFCLVGADYADWMCSLDRLDLLRWQIETVRKNNMIPVSVSHWADTTIPLMEKEDFAAHWVYADPSKMFLKHEAAVNAVANASKPVTAFKILGHTRLLADIEPNIKWLERLGVKSIVLGLENLQQARESWPVVIGALSK